MHIAYFLMPIMMVNQQLIYSNRSQSRAMICVMRGECTTSTISSTEMSCRLPAKLFQFEIHGNDLDNLPDMLPNWLVDEAAAAAPSHACEFCKILACK